MNPLSPELEPFVRFLDGLPNLDKAVFLYRLCVMLGWAGKMELTDVVEREDFVLVSFERPAGFRFHAPKLYLDRETQLEILKRLKPMLDEAEKIMAEL
jgi:hypothetical protein